MLVHQGFRFELDPNDHARSALSSHAGAARFAYNWGLATVVEALAAHPALAVLALRQGATATEAKAWADEVGGPSPGRCPPCAGAGTQPRPRWPRGGRRTPRRRTRRASTPWPGP